MGRMGGAAAGGGADGVEATGGATSGRTSADGNSEEREEGGSKGALDIDEDTAPGGIELSNAAVGRGRAEWPIPEAKVTPAS